MYFTIKLLLQLPREQELHLKNQMDQFSIEFQAKIMQLNAQVFAKDTEISAKDGQIETLTLRAIKIQQWMKDLLCIVDGFRGRVDTSVGETQYQKLYCNELNQFLDLNSKSLNNSQPKMSSINARNTETGNWHKHKKELLTLKKSFKLRLKGLRRIEMISSMSAKICRCELKTSRINQRRLLLTYLIILATNSRGSNILRKDAISL